MPNISGKGAPSKYTVGQINDIYTDSSTSAQYKCTAIHKYTTKDGIITEYEWDAITVGGSGSVDGGSAVSPIINITEIDGGHRVSVTDINGQQSFNVMDGKDGVPGADGVIGKDGEPGKDGIGISSINKVGTNNLTDTYQITFTDESTFNYEIVNGADGVEGTILYQGNTLIDCSTTGRKTLSNISITLTDNISNYSKIEINYGLHNTSNGKTFNISKTILDVEDILGVLSANTTIFDIAYNFCFRVVCTFNNDTSVSFTSRYVENDSATSANAFNVYKIVGYKTASNNTEGV